ncbi:MAG TPA: hypothetical protein VHC90_04425 [Bryobacteraceae bacterium]|nr:hypothetical protein [Bryobacteraceae bacterium]
MDNEEQMTVGDSLKFLSALAAATTKYYEALPDGSEQARADYEAALIQFRKSVPVAAESPVR